MAIVAGEVTTSCYVDLEEIIRDVITGTGYDCSDVGFDGASCAVLNAIGKQSVEINQGVENIGARRLHTVLEKLLEDISFDASEKGGETFSITSKDVRQQVGELAKDADLRKFIL